MKSRFSLSILIAMVTLSSCSVHSRLKAPQEEDMITIGWRKGDLVIYDKCPPEDMDGGWSYIADEKSWILGFCNLKMWMDGEWNDGFTLSVGLWSNSGPSCAPWQGRKERREYHKLCRKVGDVNYKGGERRVELNGPYYHSAPFAITTNFTSIEIVAPLDDFDEEHPAGTSLNDLVRVRYSTLYPFIRDGYTKQPNVGYIDGYQVRDQKLTDITAEDLRLLGPDLRFNFSKTPPYAMKIFMQIILTDEYGQKHVLEKNIFNDNYEYKQPGGF